MSHTANICSSLVSECEAALSEGNIKHAAAGNLTSCTFSNNTASNGGAVLQDLGQGQPEPAIPALHPLFLH